MSRRTAALVALSLAACGPAPPRFTPVRPGALPAQSVARAIVVDPSDAAAIEHAGGVFLGYLQLEGDSGAQIEELSGVEAARVGGTHAVAGTEGVMQIGGSSRTSPTLRSVSVFSVYYVPRTRWPELPAELRP